MTQVALSAFSEQDLQLLKESVVSKCDSEIVWCYSHTFVKTFHKPFQLEVGLTLLCSRGEVLCYGQCKQSLTSAEVSWANLEATLNL